MEELTGYVDHIIYQNENNAYTVMIFISKGEELTVVGTFPGISGGENLLIRGEYSLHPTYGKQFKASGFEMHAPEDAEAMERYLGSGAIKGIGPTLAKRIVGKFGDETFHVMEDEPERLAEVRGISTRGAMDISDQMIQKHASREAMVFLEKYGIHAGLAVKIYNRYGSELYHIIQDNPYRLAEEVDGVGFKIADDIAKRVGIAVDSEFRIRCGVEYVLNQAAGAGHTYLPRPMLVNRTAKMLGVPPEDVDANLMNLAMDKKIVIRTPDATNQEADADTAAEIETEHLGVTSETEFPEAFPTEDDLEDRLQRQQVYSRYYYHMEEMSAGMLLELNQSHDVNEALLRETVRRVSEQNDMELDEQQMKAVRMAAESGVFILTGGPGTGKTTTIRAMISYFTFEGNNIELAAPTGRAARRMSEATGHEARTIHRLLEVSGGGTDEESMRAGRFSRNEENPLEADVIIIDEMSMVDITLLYALLKAVQDKTRLIFVGDSNQLPSVGPGNVLRDLLDSGLFATVQLNTIFRQAAQSDIVLNAHRINKGEPITLDNKSRDFFFLKRYDADRIISVMLQLVRDKLPGYVEAPAEEIQILTPTRKGLLGVERLNEILQQYLNPPSEDKHEYSAGARTFREGDKVMQIRNNYQLEWEIRGLSGIPLDSGTGVFNGDTGTVKEISAFTGTMTVQFEEGRLVEYSLKQLEELELAYAITIHKSQGSEYPAVVIPLLQGPRMLMNRNLIYTALTRARKCVVMVGDEKVFEEMCANTTEAKRYSGLKDRLGELSAVNEMDSAQ